jgi:exonuclease III
MKLAAWNCRGLGNNPAVRGLLNFQKSEQVDVLFLSETKLDEKRMMAFKQKLQLGNLVAVDGVGKGGELLCYGGEESRW